MLRPGGRLALFWNAFLFPPDLAESFAEVYRRVLPDGQPFRGEAGGEEYSPFFTKAIDGMHEAGAFGQPEQWQFDWERSYRRDEWLDGLPTAGGFSLLPPETMEELLEGVGAAIDAAGGSFSMGYAAVVVTARTEPAPAPPPPLPPPIGWRAAGPETREGLRLAKRDDGSDPCRCSGW